MSSTSSPVWHPFTHAKLSPPAYPARRGDGAYIVLEDGRRIVDCISSWWVNLHGHAHPEIAHAIYRQALELEQVIFAGFSHRPAEQLAQQLVLRLPEGLSHVFYSDNGSTAVEVALKMVSQYWSNEGRPRSVFVGFDGGYHGDTIGAMSIGGASPFWKEFKNFMFSIEVVPFPHTWEGDVDVQAKEEAALAALRLVLERHQHRVAGVCLEPMVQGAGGMRMCRSDFVRAVRRMCDEHDTLLIFDEVMTGFGRTGEWFASARAGVTPDVICLSKGITGGFLPLAVTVASDRIFNSFLNDDPRQFLYHGHSYTANPLACAAALKSLELLESGAEHFRRMESLHRLYAERHLDGLNSLVRRRYCGTIFAVDLQLSNDVEYGYFNEIGQQLRFTFIEHGFLIRPLGNTIYLLPPYCVEPPLLEEMHSIIARVVATY